MSKKLKYSGSVKEIYEDTESTHLFFKFTDRYSVFDWGEMPDTLEGKGKALSLMGAFFFEYLSNPSNWNESSFPDYLEGESLSSICSKGIPSHFIGLTDAKELEVKQVDVLRPTEVIIENKRSWKYAYDKTTNNSLIPLEVIFRFGMPSGSSLKKRINDEEYLKELGLENIPSEGEFFERCVVEFSTKLEPEDRYLSYFEAKEISSMSDKEFNKLIKTTQILATQLKNIFQKIDIELWDGKFEFAFDEQRGFLLVDSIGLDELRLLHNGKHLSKEFLRQFYRGSSWLEATEEAKKKATEDAAVNWKEYCKINLGQNPIKLPVELKQKAQNLYMFMANELLIMAGKSKEFEQNETLAEFLEKF